MHDEKERRNNLFGGGARKRNYLLKKIHKTELKTKLKTKLFAKMNLLAFPNPKSLRVLRVNRRCSIQVDPWLIITPDIGPLMERVMKLLNI